MVTGPGDREGHASQLSLKVTKGQSVRGQCDVQSLCHSRELTARACYLTMVPQ
jgi:hypothetical protein